jgi:hypothetical protein
VGRQAETPAASSLLRHYIRLSPRSSTNSAGSTANEAREVIAKNRGDFRHRLPSCPAAPISNCRSQLRLYLDAVTRRRTPSSLPAKRGCCLACSAIDVQTKFAVHLPCFSLPWRLRSIYPLGQSRSLLRWRQAVGLRRIVFSNEQRTGYGTEGSQVTLKLLDARENVAIANPPGVWRAWDGISEPTPRIVVRASGGSCARPGMGDATTCHKRLLATPYPPAIIGRPESRPQQLVGTGGLP